MKRFVIHRHSRQQQQVHWDLMLEVGDALRTYRVNVPPQQWASATAEAVRIFDHPLRFLSYQGIVNDGFGRIQRVEQGTYEPLSESDRQLRLQLQGGTLKATITLDHISGDRWLLSADQGC